MPQVGEFVKRTDETYSLYSKSIDWTDRLQSGSIITGLVVHVYAEGAPTVDLAASMAPNSAILGGVYSTCVITGGVADVAYHVHHVVTTTAGAIYDDHLRVLVVACP
jgi:hypothetical protein